MAFVKLDTGILNSTLWIEREQRELFITALLMAEPKEFEQPIRQVEIGKLEWTDFEAPPGWYGFVPAASVGIIRRAGVEQEIGMEALRRLGEPEHESRSKEFEGRRMIRIDGGFLILNYMKYRDKDHTAAQRQQRLRDRKKALQESSSRRDVDESHRDATLPERNITHADSTLQSADDIPEKPSRAKAARATKSAESDQRHAEFKAAVQLYWDSKNPGIQMPWGPAEGKQLGMWLREAPQITLGQFTGFLRNRFKSQVNHGERPCQWIKWITSYGPGPTDRFKNTANQGGSNGKDHEGTTGKRLKETRLAIAEALAERGVEGPWDHAGEDGQTLPESGECGFDEGISSGLRETGPEILPPEDRIRY